MASPAFASDLGRHGVASPITVGSLPHSGAGYGLSDSEPQRLGFNRRTLGTPALGVQLAQVDEASALIASRRDEIFNDPDSPVGGNPAGDVTIVEFFDYNCPYCRLVAPTLEEIERTDADVKFIYKEFPILGPGSEFAARAALAAHKQGKYVMFHRALMAYEGRVGESAMEVAQTAGLDMERLKKDMDDPSIVAAIERNLALARTLRIAATPTFVINDGILRGAADLKAFQSVIAEARGQ
jgi:protein-disulfide isomerase